MAYHSWTDIKYKYTITGRISANSNRSDLWFNKSPCWFCGDLTGTIGDARFLFRCKKCEVEWIDDGYSLET